MVFCRMRWNSNGSSAGGRASRLPVGEARQQDRNCGGRRQQACLGEVLVRKTHHRLPSPRQPNDRIRLFAIVRQGGLTRGSQALARPRPEVPCTVIEVFDDLPRQFVFRLGHSLIPCFFSIPASAMVAREQCVFTLPSEQPMIFAAAATSSSSQ